MMQSMRKSAKIVFFIVLISFVGFMVYGGAVSLMGNKRYKEGVEPGIVGRINGAPINFYQFDESYRKKLEAASKEDREPTEQEMETARTEVWNNMTTLALIEQEAAKHGIIVSDNDVANYIRQAPPKDIVESKDFQTNGQFDINKYQVWLQQLAASPDPRAKTMLNDFESQIRQNLLVSRLQDFILSMVRITPADAKADFIEKNDKVKVRYFFIPGGDFDSTVTTVPEAEVKARYEKDKEQFKRSETAVLSYVQFPKQASAADMAKAKASIDSLHQQVIAGADFATLAKERSQDPGSGEKGGDLGWFTEDRMVKPFSDATKKLQKIGEISAPIQTQYGWHVIKLTGKRTTKDKDGKEKEEYQASHILIKTEPSAETSNELNTKAANFKEEATKRGFKEAATDFGLTPADTKPFPKGGYIQEFGMNQTLNDFAFNSNIGDISDATDSRNAFIICQLTKKTPAGFMPYEEAKDRVEKTILREKRVELAHKKGEQLATGLTQGKTFDMLAQETGKPIQETEYISRVQFIPRIGNDADFTGAAFSLSPSNSVSKAVQSKSGTYFLQYVDRQPADTTAFVVQADSLTQEMATNKRKDFWSKWLNDAKQKAEIKDYRNVYYGG